MEILILVIVILGLLLLLQSTKENSILDKKLQFKILINNQTITGENIVIQMTSVQFVEITLAPVDLRGNPAPVENIVWESSDPSMLEIVPDALNSAHIRINALGPVGAAQINVSADVNMDPEVTQNISDFVAFEIRTAFANSLGMSVTEPQDQELG
jgi:hypothetical protein